MPNKDPSTFTISIAGIPVTLGYDDLDAATRLTLIETYAAFSSNETDTRLKVELEVQPGVPFIEFGPHRTWQIRTSQAKGHVQFQSHLEEGWADLERGVGKLVLRPTGSPENFLRVIYAWLCLENQALLIHASGVIREGRGYVFFGPSGSGKTTVTRLSSDATVLSDDLVVLRKSDDLYYVYGVPFRGELLEAPRTNASAPLAGLFTLVKDQEEFLSPVSAFEAVARLSAVIPFVMEDGAKVARVVDLCIDVTHHVGVQALHFRRDANFWGKIHG